MRSFLCVAFVFTLLAGAALAEPLEHHAVLAWHKEMIHKPLPKTGCFTATYPRTKWVEETCAPPPRPDRYGPFAPLKAATGGTPSAKVTSGLISVAIGSFDTLQLPKPNAGNTAYTLQLNSQHFDTVLCAGAKHPRRCKGWQQFVYDPTSGGYIQYWLLHYESTCPGTWLPFNNDCFAFSKNGIPLGKEPLSELKHMSLGAAEINGKDTMALVTPGGKIHAFSEDSVLGLAKGWQVAEFSVYGPGNGSELKFNPGATMTVRTTVYNGTEKAPVCKQELLTGESNNLRFVPPCCSSGGRAPSVLFQLSNGPKATFVCPGSTTGGKRK